MREAINSILRIILRWVNTRHHPDCRAALGNLTPADVYLERGEGILAERERIKRQTLMDRRLRHHAQAA